MQNYFDRRQPRQLCKLYRVMTISPDNPFRWPSGVFTTTWQKEAKQNARERAEQADLPIYELPPTARPDRLMKNLPDGVYLLHEVHENDGPTIYSDFGPAFDDSDIERMIEDGPPGLAKLMARYCPPPAPDESRPKPETRKFDPYRAYEGDD